MKRFLFLISFILLGFNQDGRAIGTDISCGSTSGLNRAGVVGHIFGRVLFCESPGDETTSCDKPASGGSAVRAVPSQIETGYCDYIGPTVSFVYVAAKIYKVTLVKKDGTILERLLECKRVDPGEGC